MTIVSGARAARLEARGRIDEVPTTDLGSDGDGSGRVLHDWYNAGYTSGVADALAIDEDDDLTPVLDWTVREIGLVLLMGVSVIWNEALKPFVTVAGVVALLASLIITLGVR